MSDFLCLAKLPCIERLTDSAAQLEQTIRTKNAEGSRGKKSRYERIRRSDAEFVELNLIVATSFRFADFVQLKQAHWVASARPAETLNLMQGLLKLSSK